MAAAARRGCDRIVRRPARFVRRSAADPGHARETRPLVGPASRRRIDTCQPAIGCRDPSRTPLRARSKRVEIQLTRRNKRHFLLFVMRRAPQASGSAVHCGGFHLGSMCCDRGTTHRIEHTVIRGGGKSNQDLSMRRRAGMPHRARPLDQCNESHRAAAAEAWISVIAWSRKRKTPRRVDTAVTASEPRALDVATGSVRSRVNPECTANRNQPSACKPAVSFR